MRTPPLFDFQKNLSEINNNLSHTIFIFQQFEIDNKNLIKSSPEKFTTEHYLDNDYSHQFNVRFKDISEQAQKSLDYIYDTFFVFTNTQFEVYLRDAYLFVKNFSSKKLGEPPESKVYETVLEQLNINDADIGDLFVSTYQYFVHRRNAIMHRDKSKRLHGVMEDLIKGRDYKGKKNTSNRRKNEKLKENQLNGNELNLQWKQYRETLAKEKKKGYKIETFDFAKRDISSFILNDLFDIFNFYRL